MTNSKAPAYQQGIPPPYYGQVSDNCRPLQDPNPDTGSSSENPYAPNFRIRSSPTSISTLYPERTSKIPCFALHRRKFAILLLAVAALALTILATIKLINDRNINEAFYSFNSNVNRVPLQFQKAFYNSISTAAATTNNVLPLKYIVIVDAGSTGSRAYIYSYKYDKSSSALPDFKLISSIKVWPGLSSMATDLQSLDTYITTILDFAAFTINDPAQLKKTPIYIMATAGMRLVDPISRERIMQRVSNIIHYSKYGFLVEPSQIQIISGEMEGVFGWVSVNYLTNRLVELKSSDRSQSTIGLVDLGGGSMQLAYEISPIQDEHVSYPLTSIKLSLPNGSVKEYKVFVKSLLGYGVNEARKKYLRSMTTPNPPAICYPAEYSEFIPSMNTTIRGTGQFHDCYRTVRNLLTPEASILKGPLKPKGASDHLDPFAVPFPKAPMKIFGIAEFWNTVEDVFHLGGSGSLDPVSFFKISAQFCSRTWKSIIDDVNSNKLSVSSDPGASVTDKLKYQCFKSSWVLSLLDKFFKLRPVDDDNTSGNYPNQLVKKWWSFNENHSIEFAPTNSLDKLPIQWAVGVAIMNYHKHA